VRFDLGPGQQNDMAPACDLVRGLRAGQIIADRAYDADSLHDIILEQGGEPVIRPAAIANISTATTASPTNNDGASKASSPNSNNGDASPRATTSSPPTSSASSNSPASCSGSNS